MGWWGEGGEESIGCIREDEEACRPILDICCE